MRQGVLEDEPFKTGFPARNLAREGRGKVRSAFYANMERAMREKVGGVSLDQVFTLSYPSYSTLLVPLACSCRRVA